MDSRVEKFRPGRELELFLSGLLSSSSLVHEYAATGVIGQKGAEAPRGLPESLSDGPLQQRRLLQGLLRVPAGLGPRFLHLLPHPLLHLRVAAQFEEGKL